MDQDITESGSGAGSVARELDLVGGRRAFRVAGITVAGRRRRPSGEAAPLPRELKAAGQLWLLLGVAVFVVWFSLFVVPSSTDWWTRQDQKVLDWLVDRRTDALTSMAKAFNALTSEWFLRVLRIGTLLALIWVRRWRHFFAVLLALAIVMGSGELVQSLVARPRPLVPILADWEGSPHPSLPIAALGVTLGAMTYSLLPSSW